MRGRDLNKTKKIDGLIAVYGATGFTGGLIARRLASDGQDFVIGGRNGQRLAEFAEELDETYGVRPRVAVASVDAPDELDAMLADAEVLINCVGPFTELGKPVVESALRNSTHYLDTTGEQTHMRWIAEECDEAGSLKQIVLMPGCAFEYALGDLAAEIAWRKAASRIVVAYVVGRLKTSQGTKKSMFRTMAEGGLTFIDGKSSEKRTGYRLFDVPLPGGKSSKGAWIAGGEAITVPRRGGVSHVETCVVAGDGASYFVGTFSGILPTVMRAFEPLADRIMDRTDEDPHNDGEEDMEFLVVAFDPKTSKPHVTLSGRGVYDTTAKIAVAAAKRLLRGDLPVAGFVGAADLFEPRPFLAQVGVEISEPSDND